MAVVCPEPSRGVGVCVCGGGLSPIHQQPCGVVYVQMSCHPELNQYIQDTLHCVKPLLEKVRGPQVLRDTPYLLLLG